ncbi:MAG: tRNA uridine-5-carboxymethylaminomethyl(34) synthesis GTPase MnmE [Planctomycetes bacterium]|nr:tRNA uridine-5-carboxymethylaminomethyl(34) synthesis GTPase MnmE [Planctomycetota bacterium]
MDKDTIVAIATPRGRSARGIVRLSGAKALEVVSRCLSEPLASGTFLMCEGRFLLPDTAPFPVVVYVMRAPRSYTREDVVEIHTAGSPALLGAILGQMRRGGARLAEPGEFTRRAFLSGRIDLAQAEAVLRLITSRSDAEEHLALSALRGDLSGEVRGVRRPLLDLAVEIEAGLDFSEEDITFAPESVQRETIRSSLRAVGGILETSRARRVFREEVVAVLYGPVNAGKSSIFNMLAGSPEAIVEAAPGTTRDFLEAAVEIEGAHFLLVDTAGVRTAAEVVERIAVERAHLVVKEAQVVLFVVDASRKPGAEARRLYEEVCRLPHITVLNKADKGLAVTADDWRGTFGGEEVVEVSAVTGRGKGELELALAEHVFGGRIDLSGTRFLLEERQKACLEEAAGALGRALEALGRRAGDEIVSLDVREAVQALGSLTGEDFVEDLLEEVFSRFCVGK